MPLSSDLMGLGLPPSLAERVAIGGVGPLTITAAGSGFSTATRILHHQFVVSCTNANSTLALALPTAGELTDQYIVNNTGNGGTLPIYASAGVQISVGGTNTSSTTLTTFTSMIFYAVSTTQWIGVKGA